jgi:CRP-like cAMP-binding protein
MRERRRRKITASQPKEPDKREGRKNNRRRAFHTQADEDGGMKTETPGALYEPDDVEPTPCKRVPESQPVTVDELGKLAFFKGLSAGLLAQVARFSKRCHFDEGAVILKQEELANRFYILTCGRVLVECDAAGTRVPIEELNPGAPLGFSWFFSPDKTHFTATAQTPVEAIFFYGVLLREECDFDAELGYELMHRTGEVMLRRMEALAEKLAGAIIR